MPLLRKLLFVALEVCIFALPLTLMVCDTLNLHNTVGDAAFHVLLHPFYIGLTGMMVWLMAFSAVEPVRSRVGLSSVLVILILAWFTQSYVTLVAATGHTQPNTPAMASPIPL